MAPKTAKSKKVADVKITENEAPKKGRGKAKDVEEAEQELPEVELNGKVVVATDKKAKRGKKANESNGEHTNGEEPAPPIKRGRKKNVDAPVAEEKKANGDHLQEESQSVDRAQNEDEVETNGHDEEVPVFTAKGRKKQAKKEEKPEAKPKDAIRGRKAKQEIGAGDVEEKEQTKEVEQKPKGKGRGRKAQPKADADPEIEEKTEHFEEEVKDKLVATKGRKKAQHKEKAHAKENTPDSEKEESPEKETEDQPTEEPKKKETKGKKSQGKKAQAKEKSEEKEEVEKEPVSKKRKVNKKDEKGSGDEEAPESKSKGKRGKKAVEAVVESADEEPQDTGEEAVNKGKRKPAEEKGSGDAIDEVDEQATESKPKGKRGKKAVEAVVESADEEPQDTGEEAVNKRKRKPAEEKAEDKKPAVNKHSTNYEDIDFSNDSKNAQGKQWNFKIASWNVDGIRAWLGKGGLDYLKYEKPDILCLQETKCAQDKLPDEVLNVPGYHAYWLNSDRDGYAGVSIYTTRLAMNVQYGLQNPEFDDEGRIITAEYEHFYLICTYVPNAGRGLVTLPKRLKWNEEFRKHVNELDKKKPVIICGDMNVAHNEIDLANPKTNKKNAGFTPEERADMTQLLGDGFVDTFRHLYPEKRGAYTFWSFMKNSRAKNVGWRLDYFLVSERLLPAVCDNVIRDQVYGSDHCPLSLFLHLSSAGRPTE